MVRLVSSVGCRVSGGGGRELGVRGQTLALTSHASRFTFQARRNTQHALIAIGLIFLLSLALWLLLPPRDDGTLAEIRRRGTLRVGLDASFPPFETIDNGGQIVGLDVDIAHAIAADLGVKAELVNIGFDGLYDALLARRVDVIISGLPYDPRWTQDVAYTANYFNAGQVLVVRADDPTINSVEDVAGHTIAVEWGSQAEMEGRRIAEEVERKTSELSKTSEVSVKLLRQETAVAALDALLDGQADAAIVDAPSALSAQRRGIRMVTYLSDEWYAAAVHIQSRELLVAINQTLARLEKSGEMARLQARWLHQ